MSIRVLVTGASGFIGSHLVERLLEAGARVRAFVRPASDLSPLRGLEVEIARGDLIEGTGLDVALRGVELVYHNAALVSEWGSWREFAEVGIGGTRRLIQAAVRAGVPRLVHMSSASVYGLRRIHARTVTENLGPDPRPGRWDYYARAKIASEQQVEDADRDGRIATTILRPTLVFGPRDRVVLPRLARLLARGGLTLAGRGGNRVHLIYVGDVVDAAWRAGVRPQARGRVYHLDGRGELSQREFLAAVAELVGAPPPTRWLPLHLLYGLATAEEAWGRFTRRVDVPSRTRYLVALCGGEAHFDTSRAERELGWTAQVSARDALQRTAEWWRVEGSKRVALS